VKGGRSPLSPPVRPLHRLGIYTQHTIRHLGSCPIIAVVDGSAPKAGRAGTTAIDLGHIEGGKLALPNFGCSVWGSQRSERASLGLCCERRTKPLRPPVRPLHRLETGTPHTIRQLKSCPIIVVVGGSLPRQGVREGRNRLMWRLTSAREASE